MGSLIPELVRGSPLFKRFKREHTMDRNKMSYRVSQFLIFAGPATLLFVGTVIVPLIYGFYLTFTSWDGVSKNKPIVGLDNYVAAFADKIYWQSMGRTIFYSVFSVIFINILAFALAYLVTMEVTVRQKDKNGKKTVMNRGIWGQNFFRAGFFVPNLIGGIVLGYVWQFVFKRALVSLGNAITQGNVPSLLATSGGAMFCLILVSVWQYAGYMMLIYVAGFMSVPEDLKEAALIDGCTPAQAMKNVTIPLMRSSFVQCLFLSITRCFVIYDVNLSLTDGDPFGSSVLAAMHVYNQAFTYKNYGLGQAEALILFVVCAIIGITQVYIGKKGEVAA